MYRCVVITCDYLICSYLYPNARNSTTRLPPAAFPSSLVLSMSLFSPLMPATGVLAGAEGRSGLRVLERDARHPARLIQNNMKGEEKRRD